VIRGEWTKFTTVRSLPWLAAGALAASPLVALLLVVSLPVTQGRGIAAVPAAEVVSAGLLGVDAAAIVLMVVGASVGGSEYATGLAQPTFLVTPRRGRVVLAKVVVTASVAGGVAVTSAVLCPLVAQLVLVGAGLPAAPVDGALLRLAAGSALGPVFYALVALAAALVLRSTGGGVAVALFVLALPTVTSWVPGLDVQAPVWPGAALHGVSGVDENVGAAVGALSLGGWVAVAVVVAVWQVRVRDV
jgi:ABC-2 type transport system permease protein